MLRQTLLATFAALALVPAASASAQNAWTTIDLNFRDGPASHAQVVAYVPTCAALTTYEWQDGWVRARWDAHSGWVWGAYLASTNAHCQTGYQPPAYVPPVAAYQPPAYQPPVYQAPAYQPPTYHAPTYRAPAYHAPVTGYQPPPRRSY